MDAPQQELSIRGLGSADALLVPWQINLCVSTQGVQSSCIYQTCFGIKIENTRVVFGREIKTGMYGI